MNIQWIMAFALRLVMFVAFAACSPLYYLIAFAHTASFKNAGYYTAEMFTQILTGED